MNILTAINNEKIFKELKNKIKINYNDIQYKEGVLEALEKNKNIDFIILNEDISGQIKIEELIKKIKKINNKIKIIIILNKKDLKKEEYLIKNKTDFIYAEKVSAKEILKRIWSTNKVVGVVGNRGVGKTITTIILNELIKKYKSEKTIIIKDSKKDIFQIYNNIKNIRNNYDYIFIDIQNFSNYKFFEKIIDENILILDSNILEINKIKNLINNNKRKIKVILNNYNENSLSEEILKNIFKNKIEIIAKIPNNKNYNLIINNNFNVKYLDKNTKEKFLKIIENI